MKTSLKFLAAALALVGGQAIASPITFGFSGDILNVADPQGNTIDYQSSWFKGTVTFDPTIASADYYAYSDSEVSVISRSYGCFTYENGQCTESYGAPQSPIVLGFTLETAVGKYSVSPDMTGGFVDSGVSKIVYFTPESYLSEEAVYNLANASTHIFRSDSGASGWVVDQQAILNFFDEANVFDDFLDFSELPKSAGTFSYRDASFSAVCMDTEATDCTITPASTAFELNGTVTEIHRVDAVDVPEPTSIAILGLGLVGIGATRRRRK